MTEQIDDQDTSTTDVSRRGVIRGVAVAGLAAPLLAACGDDGETAASGEDSGADDAADSGGAPPASGDKLTTTAEVPSGGGVVLAGPKVVVTQPSDGEFKGFTAVCTHQGCVLADVTDGTINCKCHGSKFNIADGSVENGPATKSLAEVPVNVDGGSITVA